VNAPKGHNIGHIEDENQIAHALVRDRVLDDGTDTLHIDELQSDLHQQGSKHGYELPESVKKETVNKVNGLLEDTPYSYAEHGTGVLREKGIMIPDTEALRKLRKPYKKGIDNFISFKDLATMIDNPSANVIPSVLNEFNELSRVIGLDDMKGLAEIADPFVKEGRVPNYPFKDDWYNTGLKELLFDAIRDGKDAISISTSAAMKSRYTDKYHKFYESLYDQKIPSAMKKLAKKYGGKFEKGRLDIKDVGGEAYYNKHMEKIIKEQEEPIYKANIIKITPKMREKIIAEGLPSFGYRSGGMVDKAITGGSRYI
jgi:hypothetical protein